MAYEKFTLYFTFIDQTVNKLIHITMHVGLFDSTLYSLSYQNYQNFFSISSKKKFEKELSVHI